MSMHRLLCEHALRIEIARSLNSTYAGLSVSISLLRRGIPHSTCCRKHLMTLRPICEQERCINLHCTTYVRANTKQIVAWYNC